MSTFAVPALRLRHGALMPQIGLGTWPMSDDEAETAVAQAIGLGYRLFDTAYAYGNEAGVGRGLRAGGVAREELFVTTKLNGEFHGYREAQDALTASAGLLGLDYVDLYLIHWPLPARDRYVDAWRGLLKLLEDGKVRAIGTSNFKPAHIDRLLEETGVAPDVNQIELNPTLTRERTRDYDAGHGIRSARAASCSSSRRSRRSQSATARPPPRSCCAGTSSSAWARCRSPRARSGWRRTSTSSISP